MSAISEKVEKQEYDHLLGLLREKVPFAFARFNDGEMKAIGNTKSRIARGDQEVTTELRTKLQATLESVQPNYWIGKPCRRCFPNQRKVFDQIIPKGRQNLTHAVIFCNNGHWNFFIKDFPEAVAGRYLTWIASANQNMSALEQQLELDVSHVVKVPSVDGFSRYDSVCHLWTQFQPGQVVVMTCGPMSRVLAASWFKHRPDCTFFDAGSLFDPFTRNVWHGCHRGTLKPCTECNHSMGIK